MKRKTIMSKSNFLNGAFITTLGIIITKLFGVLYVIPFHSIIGEKGGALYGYAYTIYLFFMTLATAGIPLAISKITSEYQSLGYYNIKKKTFIIGKRIAIILGLISFIIINIFAPLFAYFIIGDINGGNSVQDVTFVIRIISIAIIIVPLLSVYRGYFEGHRFMKPASFSQVIEQIVRVSIIVVGSYLSYKIFHFNLRSVVGIALLGAVIGAFISYFYLLIKMSNNKSKFQRKVRSVNEPKIEDKVIIKKIIIYAIPFILIDVYKSVYNYVDMFTVVKGLVNNANYSVNDAEMIYAMLSTWALKFNMIVQAISTGIIVSLIPSITESIVKNRKKILHSNICQAFDILLYLTVPLTLMISFLSKPIWILFYGNNTYGPNLLSYYIFLGLFIGLFTTIVTILQTLKDYKIIFISLLIGILIKIICNLQFIRVFNIMGFPAYYGIITASILGYLISFIICFIYLIRKYKISFEKLIHNFIDVICGSILMVIVLFISRLLIPDYSNNFIINLLLLGIYGIIGLFTYFVFTYNIGVFRRIFGDRYVKKM